MKPADTARGLLIRRATLLEGTCVDVRIERGVVAELGERVEARPNESWIDARGGLLLPGLHDHHMHLFATAAALQSLSCGPPDVVDEAGLREALEDKAREGSGDWIRGVGFHESVCPQLDRDWLDAVCPDRPVRIQHRSGIMWVYNTCAVERLSISAGEQLPPGVELSKEGRMTGRFFNLDEWLGSRLERSWPSLRELSRRLAMFGITSVTDTGVANGLPVWRALGRAVEEGDLLQRVLVMGDETLQQAPHDPSGRLALGPLKIYLREVALPELDALVVRIRDSHQQGRAVAVHCVTRVELTFLLVALQEAGVVIGDRVEHAAVADDDALERLAALGVTVVTQPHFIAERGVQYRQSVDAVDMPFLYRGAGFLRAGVRLAAGSDAPYGGTDPWAGMRAAMLRRDVHGEVMAPNERLDSRQALALYGGEPCRPGGGFRQLEVGQEADLCLLGVTERQALADLDAKHVRLTLRGGSAIYRSSAFGRG